MIRKHRDFLSNVISSMTVDKLIHKGSKVCLAYILNTKLDNTVMENIHVVKEFTDIFPEECLIYLLNVRLNSVSSSFLGEHRWPMLLTVLY